MVLGSLISFFSGRSQGGLYEPILADSEREAVSDLLQYLENVRTHPIYTHRRVSNGSSST